MTEISDSGECQARRVDRDVGSVGARDIHSARVVRPALEHDLANTRSVRPEFHTHMRLSLHSDVTTYFRALLCGQRSLLIVEWSVNQCNAHPKRPAEVVEWGCFRRHIRRAVNRLASTGTGVSSVRLRRPHVRRGARARRGRGLCRGVWVCEPAAMIRPANEGIEVWVCVEPVDFRKQITGLATLVQDRLAMDPFSAQLFVFVNRRRTQCRILYWERCGFVLWQKRLERARFDLPVGRRGHPIPSGCGGAVRGRPRLESGSMATPPMPGRIRSRWRVAVSGCSPSWTARSASESDH